MAKAEKKQQTGGVKVTLVKSTIACNDKQIKTVQALGLRKIGQSKIFPDNAVTQGMVHTVRHLVKVESA